MLGPSGLRADGGGGSGLGQATRSFGADYSPGTRADQAHKIRRAVERGAPRSVRILEDTPELHADCPWLTRCQNRSLLGVTTAGRAALTCIVKAPAVSGWNFLTNIFGGSSAQDAVNAGTSEFKDCGDNVVTAWNVNMPGNEGREEYGNCEHQQQNGCPVPADTPCYPGCPAGRECVKYKNDVSEWTSCW